MNNLSACLAQTTPTGLAAATPPGPSSMPATSRSILVSNARSWAEKALELTSSIKPPIHNEECDSACAVATHNIGEFAEMEGKIEEARRKYNDARSLSKAIGFSEGISQADKGLRRLAQP